jgi:hypothetical protein
VDREDKKPSTRNTTARKTLGERLIEERLVTTAQLESATAIQQQQGGRLGDILIKQGLVKPEDMAIILSIHLNLPLIDLKRHEVNRARCVLSEEMARKHAIIRWISSMIADGGDGDPEDVRTIEDIKAQVKMRVEVALGVIEYRAGDRSEIQVKKRHRKTGQPVYAVDIKIDDPAQQAARPRRRTRPAGYPAVKDRASDTRTPGRQAAHRYRIDGILHDMFSFP